MRILHCSDLHVDIGRQKDPNWFVDPDLFDIAVVNGDIANHGKTTLRYMTKFKEKVCSGKRVITIPGNHDRWGSLFSTSEYFMQQLPDYLNRKEIEFMGHRLLGCTLWYKPSIFAHRDDWSDYESITDWENITSEHEQDMKFLQDELSEGDIVLTHMLPGTECIDIKWMGNSYNSFYLTEMADLIKERKPLLWLMGHSHEPMNKMVHNTLMIRNPRGYPRENCHTRFNMWIIDTDKIGQYDCVTSVDPEVKE